MEGCGKEVRGRKRESRAPSEPVWSTGGSTLRLNPIKKAGNRYENRGPLAEALCGESLPTQGLPGLSQLVKKACGNAKHVDLKCAKLKATKLKSAEYIASTDSTLENSVENQCQIREKAKTPKSANSPQVGVGLFQSKRKSC